MRINIYLLITHGKQFSSARGDLQYIVVALEYQLFPQICRPNKTASDASDSTVSHLEIFPTSDYVKLLVQNAINCARPDAPWETRLDLRCEQYFVFLLEL